MGAVAQETEEAITKQQLTHCHQALRGSKQTVRLVQDEHIPSPELARLHDGAMPSCGGHVFEKLRGTPSEAPERIIIWPGHSAEMYLGLWRINLEDFATDLGGALEGWHLENVMHSCVP